MPSASSTPAMVTRDDLSANVTSFARHMRAANLSPAGTTRSPRPITMRSRE